MTRQQSTPPQLVGFTPIELIGSGGYADVFLYEQHMPRRKVAVKVLVSDSLGGDLQRRQFAAEANLMAQVSTHPFIVSIFHADVAPDGRPYIIMEYYPGENFLKRARSERFGVAEVLRVGVQVGSALETAHRARILHRDIKPANILTSEYRRPGLADFGIASAAGPEQSDGGGVSIPWSPPEAFGDAELDARADVYALAATLYHLLAGRSPFELPSGDNSAVALMSRIERLPVPPIGRADVPASLERALGQAMAKNPAHRPASVVALLRQLQEVEAELRLAVTPLELADDGSTARARLAPDDDDATRVKGVTELRAQDPVAIESVPERPTGVGPARQRQREGLLAEPEVGETVMRATPAAATPPVSPTSRSRRWLPYSIGGAVAVIGVVVAVLLAGGGGNTPSSPADTQPVFDNLPGADVQLPVPVESFTGSDNGDGTYHFEWTAPEGGPWTYVVTEVGPDARPATVEETAYDAATSCIDVETMNTAGALSATTRGCVP
ncbi:MAG: protein kinase [Acidimicrobiaceae bacterium]|nr:protein kinase [Acidimicrobiaceae bacterium]